MHSKVEVTDGGTIFTLCHAQQRICIGHAERVGIRYSAKPIQNVPTDSRAPNGTIAHSVLTAQHSTAQLVKGPCSLAKQRQCSNQKPNPCFSCRSGKPPVQSMLKGRLHKTPRPLQGWVAGLIALQYSGPRMRGCMS